jgi:RNA polymerase sigma-70 factor (ECF subfamily)
LDGRSDEELLVATPADSEAFAEFYRRHVDKVVGFALRRLDRPEEVADLVAAVFVRVIESAGSFDPRRGRALPWLFGVAANTVADERRRAARRSRATQRLGGRRYLDADDHVRVEERLDAQTSSRRLHAAMQRLSPGEQAVTALVLLDGLTPSAAAEALGVRPIVVRARLARARRKLRRAVDPGAVRDPGHQALPYTEETHA